MPYRWHPLAAVRDQRFNLALGIQLACSPSRFGFGTMVGLILIYNPRFAGVRCPLFEHRLPCLIYCKTCCQWLLSPKTSIDLHTNCQVTTRVWSFWSFLHHFCFSMEMHKSAFCSLPTHPAPIFPPAWIRQGHRP